MMSDHPHEGLPSVRPLRRRVSGGTMCLLGLVALAFAVPWTPGSAGPRPDFAGHWRLDVARSTGLPAGYRDATTLVIRQTADRLFVERTSKGKTTAKTYALDGSTLTVKEGDVETMRRTRWEGETLITEGVETRRILGATVQLAIKEIRRMAPNGTMEVETSIQGGGHEQRRTTVYKRVER